MTDQELDQLDDRFPEVALAALNAASEAAKKSNLPRVVLIDGSLYRISPSGDKELLRMLEPWVTVEELVGRPDA